MSGRVVKVVTSFHPNKGRWSSQSSTNPLYLPPPFGETHFSMTANIGFLSVRVHPEHGYFGGYLIVNQLARPLEFHCTMPVKPSRAQAVLYGPTIDDFVCGEQIGKALVSKARVTPDLIITDSLAALAVTLVSELRVVKLEAELSTSDAGENLRMPKSTNLDLVRLRGRDHNFVALADSPITDQHLEQLLGQLSANFEITEPFQRITEALLEAHPITKAA